MHVINHTIDAVPEIYLFILWQPHLFRGTISDLPQKFSTHFWIHALVRLY
jgi:hypothetical protein